MNAFLASIKAKLAYFWANHIQKTISAFLVILAGSDVVAYLTGFEHDITTLIGGHWYAGLRVALGSLIFWRAKQATLKPPEPPQ